MVPDSNRSNDCGIGSGDSSGQEEEEEEEETNWKRKVFITYYY
jgi:hypothetical protein